MNELYKFKSKIMDPGGCMPCISSANLTNAPVVYHGSGQQNADSEAFRRQTHVRFVHVIERLLCNRPANYRMHDAILEAQSSRSGFGKLRTSDISQVLSPQRQPSVSISECLRMICLINATGVTEF